MRIKVLNNTTKMAAFFIGFYLLLVILVVSISACGSGGTETDSAVIVEPVEYSEKISNILILSSSVIFAVEVADGRFELFHVDPITGIKNGVSDTFSANNGLRPVAVSPDETMVAYRADKDNDGFDELYSNTLNGENEVLLTDGLSTTLIKDDVVTTLYNWQWTGASSGNQIIFRSDPGNDDIYEIRSIQSDGSNLRDLTEDLETTCHSNECWKVNADGSVITFLVESTNEESVVTQSIYAVTPDVGEAVLLNESIVEGTIIRDWQWSPDFSSIAYLSQSIDQPSWLYTIDPDATNRVLLNPDSILVGVSEFSWAPDSTRIAFTDDGVTGEISLYNNLVDGTDRVHLIDTFDVANPEIIDFQWAPNSERIAYRADQITEGIFELFTVETDGEWHRKMNGALLAESTILENWAWSPDSNYIYFFAEILTEPVEDELYISAADGSGSNKVSLALNEGESLVSENTVWLEDENTRALFQIDHADGYVDAMYSVLPDGSQPLLVTPEVSNGDLISDWVSVSPDKTNLLMQLELSNGEVNLARAAIDGSAENIISNGGMTHSAQWLLDGSRIIYVNQSPEDASEILYSALPDGTGKVVLYE